MKRTLRLLGVSLLVTWASQVHAKLNVVATTADLGALAREIGGDRIELTILAKPTEDAHFVDARPSFIVRLNHADVLIEGGAELEIGWLPSLLEGARNPKLEPGAPGRVACSQGIQLLEVPSALDRSKGDIHAAGNPHYSIDPVNAKIVAGHIADSFCKADPRSCDAFRTKLKAFSDQLDARMAVWQETLDPFRGRRIVAYHNDWPYFAQRYGLKIDLFLEPKPGIPPTPAHLAEVIATMKAENIRAVLVEPFQNRRTAERVAEETSATVVEVTQQPGGVKGTERGYLPLLDYLVNSLAKALGEKAK